MVDYAIVSQTIFPLIKMFKVAGITEMSHHCNISFIFKAEVILPCEEKVQLDNHPDKVLWDGNFKQSFVESLSSSECINQMDLLFCSTGENDIDKLTSNFTDIIVNNAKNTFPVKTSTLGTKKNKQKVKHQKWYDKS